MEVLDLVGVFGVPGISTVEEAPTGALQTTVQTTVTYAAYTTFTKTLD